MSENTYSTLGEPIGTDYNPRRDELTPQEAVDRIDALLQRARRECYLPEDPDANNRNAGRVRALAQAITLLERASIEPNETLYLNDSEEMVDQ